MPKGRRTGFTFGASNHIVEENLEEEHRVLWVDTIHANIDRYVDRYFLPKLKLLPRSWWQWNKQSKEMKLCDSIIDFRSADKPENIEGFGYDRVYGNEAGIILKGVKGRYLYEQAITPMTADYGDKCIQFWGGTPKGVVDKSGHPHKFFELCESAKMYDDRLVVHMSSWENPFIPRIGVANMKIDLPVGPARDQEYYGKFVCGTGDIIKREWIPATTESIGGKTCRSWDLAVKDKAKSDYTAGALCTKSKTAFQIKDVVSFKKLWPDAQEIIIATAIKDGPDVTQVFEDAGQMGGLIENLRADTRMNRYKIREVRPKGEKFARAMVWVSRASTGNVSLVHGAWNGHFLDECASFTNDDSHPHDDQIDAVSQAWIFLSGGNGPNIGTI